MNIKDQVLSLVKDIETGELWCEECDTLVDTNSDGKCVWCGSEAREASGSEWLHARALEITHRVTEACDHLGSEITVSVGGPHISIDTQRNVVRGTWGSETVEVPYNSDPMGLDETCEELWALALNAKSRDYARDHRLL